MNLEPGFGCRSGEKADDSRAHQAPQASPKEIEWSARTPFISYSYVDVSGEGAREVSQLLGQFEEPSRLVDEQIRDGTHIQADHGLLLVH